MRTSINASVIVDALRKDYKKRHPSPTRKTIFTLELNGNLYHDEVIRLEAKYGGVLHLKDVADELGIVVKTLKQRMYDGVDLPEFIETVSGRPVFTIPAVATYLSKGLVKRF